MEKREFGSDQTAVIYMAQECNPRLMQVYFHWLYTWRKDPENGRGLLRDPYYNAPQLGDGLFWDLLDERTALVQCYPIQGVRRNLEKHLGVSP